MKHNYEISNGCVTLIPLSEQNTEAVRLWRNTDSIRNCFISSDIISAEQQKRWFSSYLVKENDFVFVICGPDGSPIGMTALYNFSADGQSAEFGRFLIGEQSARGKGYGKQAIRLTLDIAFLQMKLFRVTLEVFEDNPAAYGLYKSCGFRVTGQRKLNDRTLVEMEITEKTNQSQ